jgi:hypothetical protein
VQPNAEDLSDLERRLAAVPPASAGLNADAMLFAAGRASTRRGLARFLWPALSVALAVAVVVLVVSLQSERQQRQAIARQLQQAQPAVVPSAKPNPASPEYQRSPLLEVHRALEQDKDPLPDDPVGVESSSTVPEVTVFRPRSIATMLDP